MINNNVFDIIKYPLITEKTTMLSEQRKYVFEVAANATKQSIEKAIENIFSVKVEKINIINIPGKVKRFKGRLGKKSDLKKAVVTLEKDNSIDLSGGIK